ncbi:MAG TPA: transcriptional repressor LexA [Candidatus Saccharimonadales bacterium]|jgi:repressor LexA|nr:transcriptional repressor LexA [Candidatus Saccharimonadales bacterium]
MAVLTEIQRRVFEFVRQRLVHDHLPPTVREIAAEFGYRSKRAAECHLAALARKGWLAADPGKARSLRLGPAAQPVRGRIADIPLFGSIPAGFGSDREQEVEGCVSVNIESIGFKPTRNTFALRVVGDSMIGKHILDGDIVMLEHGPEPRPGQIVAALIDRKSTLKTFLLKNGRPFLKAENPKYPDLIPAEELMIQGVFRALLRGEGKIKRGER